MSQKGKCSRCEQRRVLFGQSIFGAVYCRFCFEMGLSGALGRVVLLSPKGIDSRSGKHVDGLLNECRGRLSWG